MATIEILDLEKTYHVGFWRKRPKLALRPLRLTIEQGEVFGFLGPERGRQDNHAQTADGAGLSDGGDGADIGDGL